jgi:DNA-binding YbaB/EbfC family protein
MNDEHGIAAAMGGMDFGQLLGMAQGMQAKIAETQAALSSTVVEGSAGGGAVRIGVSGGFEFQSVSIDRSLIDPEDPTMLEDMILAALRDAAAKVTALQNDANPMSGVDLGGLGGLLGG